MTPSAKERRQSVNTPRRILVAVLLLLLIVASLSLALTGPDGAGADDLSGSILLWHALSSTGAETMDTVLQDFETLHPNTQVYQQPFDSEDDLLEQYRESVESGLGPDIVLGDAEWITSLAQENKIRPLEEDTAASLAEEFLPEAIETVSYDDELYGLPFSLHVPALYYNTRLVESPPESLDALLTQAAEGNTVLMSTEFRDSFWGTQAFGGRFLDDEGRAILDQGGYANWLDWLMSARTAPGMILDTSRESLQQRFLQGDDAYYIGYPEEIETLIEGLGEDNLGVAPLPSGPTGSAGPFLGVDALLFSPVSSENQRDLGVALAEYLTNAEQGAAFMRQAQRVPANTRVRINPRLHPLLAGFAAQARSAIAMPNVDTDNQMWEIATSAYNRVLSGLSTPQQAAAETTAALNELNDFAAVPQAESVCTDLGTVRLVHGLEGTEADVLDEIVQAYRSVCPLVIVNAQYQDMDVVRENWRDHPLAATNPDLVLASQEWLVDALSDGLQLRDISGDVSSDVLQRYLPTALAAMRQGISLYGLPVAANVYVLYYNRGMVDDPAPVLDRLRQQADNGIPITLEAQFAPAYWGVGASGGRLFDVDGRPALDEGGFADWLSWLKVSRDEHGMQLVFDRDDAREAFLDGRSAYYVGVPEDRDVLIAGFDEDVVGVALLPAGPEGDATPLFLASGLLFNGAISDAEVGAALNFAAFATNADNQLKMVERTELVPVNTTVELSDKPDVMTFLEQARTAFPLPNQPQIGQVIEMGDEAYRAVLVDGVDPQHAASVLTQQMNELYGFEVVEPTATPSSDNVGSEQAGSAETPTTAAGADATLQPEQDTEVDEETATPLESQEGVETPAVSAENTNGQIQQE